MEIEDTPLDGEPVSDAAGIELAELLGDEDLGSADPFEDAEAEDSAESAEAGAGTEAGEDPAHSPTPKTVPYKRLKRVVEQRNAAEARAKELEAAESKLREELSGAKAFRETVAERYGRFRNPTAQLALDADFMSAMEELAQKDADVNAFYKKVLTYMETGSRSSAPAAREVETAPVKDPRLEKVLERYAANTVRDVLAPLQLQPKYARLLENHVLQNAKDVSTLDAKGVKDLARQFIADSGFTLEEMRKAKDSPVTPAKPKTGRGGAPAPAPAKKAAAAQPKEFKTRAEWLQHREGVVKDIIAELTLE